MQGTKKKGFTRILNFTSRLMSV